MEKRRFIFMMMLITALPTIIGGASAEPLYRNSGESIDVRAKDLLGGMTLQEKIAILAGKGSATPQNDRLGIPALKCPIALWRRWQRSTSFPAGIAMAASYDRNLMRKVANAMGLAVERRVEVTCSDHALESPLPFGGRNFEGMGEDPYLTGEMATAYVEGLNDQKVVGSVKHFALNDQEANRTTIDSIADERALEGISSLRISSCCRGRRWFCDGLLQSCERSAFHRESGSAKKYFERSICFQRVRYFRLGSHS